MITVTLRYSLTSEAQRALVLAGQQVGIQQTHAVDIPLAEALSRGLARIESDGTVTVYPLSRIDSADLQPVPRPIGYTTARLLDRLLTGEETLALWRQDAVDREAHQEAERASEQAAATAKRAEKIAEQTRLVERAEADISGLFPNGRLGEHGPWLSYSDMPDDLAARIRAAIASAQAYHEAAEQAALAERGTWIRLHGSERLKKAAALGLLEKSIRVYEDERLAVELPEASGWDSNAWEDQDVHNPSLAALETLERMLKIDPTAKLISQAKKCDECDDEPRQWRPVVLVDFEWASRTARVEIR